MSAMLSTRVGRGEEMNGGPLCSHCALHCSRDPQPCVTVQCSGELQPRGVARNC